MDKAQMLSVCFRAAGISQEEFASQIGVTRRFPMMVAAGERTSKRVSQEIDRFIAENLNKIKSHADHYEEAA
jgi:transcriptional regulator with XRE-family HTH domain